MTLFKLCNKCEKCLPLLTFHKDKSKKDGYHSICKFCQKINKDNRKEGAKQVRQEYEKKNAKAIKEYWKQYNSNSEVKTKLKEKHLVKSYNISLEELELLKIKQIYSCAICFTHEKDCSRQTLFVDHNHDTGKVRGLLCSQCNSALGLFYDNKVILNNAIGYLNNND